MKTARRTISALTWLSVTIGWLLLLLAMPLWPASWWLEVRSTVVTDQYTAAGNRVMQIDRTIHRNFIGDFRVEAQKKLRDLYFTIEHCETRGIRYRADASLPDPVTVEWWKGDNCKVNRPFMALPPGTYRLCTWWTIHPTYFPPKEVSICSPDYRRK